MTLWEHLQQSLQIFACLENEQWYLAIIYPLFQIHFSTDFLFHSLFHLNIISLFILYSYLSSFIPPIFISTTIFFNKKYYIYNIFCNTFTSKLMWKIVTSSNLNPPLKLFFYSQILTNNNLLLKIYCKNIVVAFLN